MVIFQSTPSARRATAALCTVRDELKISIHALREEGDPSISRRASAWWYFNPRPPRGGRRLAQFICVVCAKFQSTPSARWATATVQRMATTGMYFNPRPPRGGRLAGIVHLRVLNRFQSTPSARRATFSSFSPMVQPSGFQSTPSARRATAKAAKKSNAFVPLYTLVHNLKRNFTKAPAK